MAFKIISGGKKTSIEEIPRADASQKTDGPGLLSRLGVAAVKGLELPGELLNQIGQLLGEPSFMKQRLSQDIQQAIGGTPEQYEPQGPIEKYAQRVLTQIPTAAVSGGFLGGAVPAVVRTAVSAVPAVAAGEAGAPEWAQDLIQLGSDIGLAYRGGSLKSPSISKAQKNAYETAKSLVSDAERPGAKSVIEGLAKAGKALETNLEPRIENAMKLAIDKVKENIVPIFKSHGRFEPGLNPKKALALRVNLNKLGAKNKDLLEFTKPIIEGIDELLVNYGSESPAFTSLIEKGKSLTVARHMKSYLKKLGKSLPIVGGKKKIGSLVGSILGEGEKALRRLTNPEVREIYKETIKSMVQGSAAPVIQKNLIELGDAIKEPDKVVSRPTPKRFKIISGKRI